MFIHIYTYLYIHIFNIYRYPLLPGPRGQAIRDTFWVLVLSSWAMLHLQNPRLCSKFQDQRLGKRGWKEWIKPPKLKWRAPTPYNDRSGTPNSGSSVDWLWIIQAFGDFPVLKLMTLGDKSLVFDLIMDGSILHDGWVSFRSFMIYGSKTLISNLFIFFLQTPWMSRCLNTLPKLPQDDGFQ